MSSADEEVSGDPWQEYVDSLLNIHFSLKGGVYQRIPAKGNGDGGLEGFSNCGHGFQAYSDEGTLSHKERTQKQKGKITKDLRKLKTNRKFWEAALQGVKLRRWSLIVPKLDDKAVVAHARKKAAELREAKLPFIADDFEAFVETADAFPQARAQISEPTLVSKSVFAEPVTDDHISDLENDDPDFIRNLDFKLLTAAPGGDPDENRRDYLKWHLECSNFMTDLQRKYPSHWESIDRLATRMSAAIQTKQRSDTTPPPQRLLAVQEDVERRLEKTVGFLTEQERMMLAWGHVAKWMGECSLFKGLSNG